MIVTLGEPVVTFLLAIGALVNLTCTSAVSVGLIAVSTIITESSIMRAVLPANRTHTRVSFLAEWIAKCSILLLFMRA